MDQNTFQSCCFSLVFRLSRNLHCFSALFVFLIALQLKHVDKNKFRICFTFIMSKDKKMTESLACEHVVVVAVVLSDTILTYVHGLFYI